MPSSTRRFLGLSGLCLLAGLCAWGAVSAETSQLTAEIEQALSAKCLSDSQTGVSIVALPEDQPIYQRNPDTPLLPASVQKMLTTAGVLHYLGPEYRFQTDVLYSGSLNGGLLQGDLILRGGGDPMLSPEKLWQIAKRLYDQGLRQVNGRLIADSTFFDGESVPPGWDQYDVKRNYNPKIGALSINYNLLAVHVQPGGQAGAPLSAWLEPAPAHIRLRVNGQTVGKGKNSVGLSRNETQDIGYIEVNGTMPLNAQERVFYLHIDDPARYTAETFRAFLNEQGITVAGGTLQAPTPLQAALLYRHESPPLPLILKELNTYSNNFIAEQLVKTLAALRAGAPGTHANGLKLVEAFLRDSGVHMQGVWLSDGSGLSKLNRFTARAMTDFLGAMLPRFDIGPDFMAALRVVGADGSVSKRLKNSPAHGKIRAKTGTLNGVRNLAGYVSSTGGRVFAYALFFNEQRCGVRAADNVADQIINALYLYGDQARPLTLVKQEPEPLWGAR